LSGFGPSCGGPLVEHKDVKKVSFTGSVETGRTVYKAAAEKLIPVTLELGGKSPMIVMDDADLDKAIAGAVGGMRFTRQGQSCTASSRILVHEKLHDEFVKRLIDKVNALKMGDPLDEETDIGTIINRKQFDKVRSYIDIGEKEGATKHELSALPTDSALADGTFVRPVIFTNVDPNARVAREE
ncbi:MAG TPA: aldehyde dehydrogenase, partial [Thalassospira lucentensis]